MVAAKKKSKKKAAKKKAKKKETAASVPPPPPPVPVPPGMQVPAAAVAAVQPPPAAPVEQGPPGVQAPPTVAPVAPAAAPPVVQAPPQVPVTEPPSAQEMVVPKSPSLITLRQFFRTRTSPDEQHPGMFTVDEGKEIDEMICFIQAASAEHLVTEYPRLVACLLFWKNKIKSQERSADKDLRIAEAKADGVVRKRLVEEGGKTTEAMVTAGKLQEESVQNARNFRDNLSTVVYQFEALLSALNTDMLVQASLWTRPDKVQQAFGA